MFEEVAPAQVSAGLPRLWDVLPCALLRIFYVRPRSCRGSLFIIPLWPGIAYIVI